MPTSNKSLFSSTENIKEIIAATRGTDDESNEVAVVPRSTSLAIKHEREDASIRFGNEVALMNEELENNEMKINENALEDKNAQKDIFIPNEPAKKRRTDNSSSESPMQRNNYHPVGAEPRPFSFGTVGFNHSFCYSAPSHQHSGPVFPGQSPPFQSNHNHCFVGMGGMSNSLPMGVPPPLSNHNSSGPSLQASAGLAQPVVITHVPLGTTYATVPYPYHNHYPTGQPMIRHPNGNFYPAVMNVISSDSQHDDAILLTRIVDDPPDPPNEVMGQPKKWIRWTDAEDLALKRAVKLYGEDKMELISRRIFYNTRDDHQCKQRWKKALQPGLIKGKWTKEEDDTLSEMVATFGTKWSDIAKRLPGRLAEQVKDRWVNHLDPEIRKGVWTKTEMDILIDAQKELGNKWAEIAKRIPGRSENSVKNRWYNAKTSAKRKASKEEEERKAMGQISDESERRESNETVQSLIFKAEEDL